MVPAAELASLVKARLACTVGAAAVEEMQRLTNEERARAARLQESRASEDFSTDKVEQSGSHKDAAEMRAPSTSKDRAEAKRAEDAQQAAKRLAHEWTKME